MNAEVRLKLIEDRCTQYGCDGDTLWLISEVKRLGALKKGADAFQRELSQALNSGDGSYRP